MNEIKIRIYELLKEIYFDIAAYHEPKLLLSEYVYTLLSERRRIFTRLCEKMQWDEQVAYATIKSLSRHNIYYVPTEKLIQIIDKF